MAAYFFGHSQGRSLGFEDGAVWAGRSADMTRALRAMSILDVLQQRKDYARVAEALNHDIDYAILEILDADDYLRTVRLSRKIQRQDQLIRDAFKPTGTDEHTGYRHLAEFRRKHPTASTDQDVVEVVKKLLEKY
jgi:hypothetical protein